MKTCLASIFVLFLLPESAIAGPDETTQHLMNDTASMLDFGLLRLNLKLEADNLGTASYNWEENRIQISLFSLEKGTVESAEIDCANWIDAVRVKAGIDLDAGQSKTGSSSFANLFTHYGFERRSVMEGLQGKIDKIITLGCYQWGTKKPVTIKAPLLGKGYSLQK